MRRIINIDDTLYEVLGTMNIQRANNKGTEYWKERWHADTVLKSGGDFYFCMDIIEAEFEDIK